MFKLWDNGQKVIDGKCLALANPSISTRTHVCECGCVLDRDHNAAINILNIAIGTVGHTGTLLIERNALPRLAHHAPQTGDLSSTGAGEILSQQVGS